MPEISVVVPLYNGEKFIEKCYSSLKAQDFKDFEIIFVDDGSTDNSLKILKEIEKKDNAVKAISQENKKQGGARNTGVKNASGKYIAYVDVDDYVSKDFLSGLYEAITEFDCEISMTSVIRHKEGKKERYLLKYDEKRAYEDIQEKHTITNGNGTGRGIWNKLFKREFLLKNNLEFRENVFYEDADYCAKAVFCAKRIATTNKGNYFYFVNRKSTMRSLADSKKQFDRYLGARITVLFELEHGLRTKSALIPKFDYSIFGLNLMRVKEKISLEEAIEQWWLFDFVKIFQKKLR